jgi:hypothetical protein
MLNCAEMYRSGASSRMVPTKSKSVRTAFTRGRSLSTSNSPCTLPRRLPPREQDPRRARPLPGLLPQQRRHPFAVPRAQHALRILHRDPGELPPDSHCSIPHPILLARAYATALHSTPLLPIRLARACIAARHVHRRRRQPPARHSSTRLEAPARHVPWRGTRHPAVEAMICLLTIIRLHPAWKVEGARPFALAAHKAPRAWRAAALPRHSPAQGSALPARRCRPATTPPHTPPSCLARAHSLQSAGPACVLDLPRARMRGPAPAQAAAAPRRRPPSVHPDCRPRP